MIAISSFNQNIWDNSNQNNLTAFIQLFTVKKLPIFLLEVMVSRFEYESCDTKVWVDNYLIAFIGGFAKVFSLAPEEITVEMFAYFISLRFPPRKVKKIVEMLHNADTLSLDLFENVKISSTLNRSIISAISKNSIMLI